MHFAFFPWGSLRVSPGSDDGMLLNCSNGLYRVLLGPLMDSVGGFCPFCGCSSVNAEPLIYSNPVIDSRLQTGSCSSQATAGIWTAPRALDKSPFESRLKQRGSKASA